MTDEEPRQNRISARVVEEGYVTLQDAMRTYRQARDQGNDAAGLPAGKNPVIVLQDAVQTFFSLIRPYLADEPRLAEYWRGALATHPDTQHRSADAALEYYREHSVGVWQAQHHTQVIPRARMGNGAGAQATALSDGGSPSTLADWHEALNLPATVRVLSVHEAGADDAFDGWFYKEGRFAVMGLREVTDWRVETRRTREHGDGFMAGTAATTEEAQPQPAAKVETAARMLAEVADELGAIATYEPAGDRVHGTPVPGEDT